MRARASNLYARGYVSLIYGFDQLSISPDGARIFFIVFRAGSNNLAYAGWRVQGGVPRWCLTLRDGTGYVNVYQSTPPKWIGNEMSSVAWYCVELHWKRGTTDGGAELWADGVKVCSLWGVNTAAFGDVTSVRVGQAEVYGTIYQNDLCFDCVKLSTTYIGPEPKVLSDGFESGSFSNWTGTVVTSGETASVSSTRAHHGAYSAKFTTNGGGGHESAYAYKAIAPMLRFYDRGYYYVSKSGIADVGDRMFFIVLRSGSTNVAYAGWKKDKTGAVKWCLTVRNNQGGYTDLYYMLGGDPNDTNQPKPPGPALGRWFCVEVYWERNTYWGYVLAELYVNGILASSTVAGVPTNFSYFSPVSTVRFGLGETYGVASSTVYADCCVVETSIIGLE